MILLQKPDIKSMSLAELTGAVTAIGEKPFRAKQLFEWLHQKHITGFSEITSFSGPLKEKLAQEFSINSLNIKKKLVSAIDGTVKYLYGLKDSNCIETILMHYKHGTSLCISTQVGCAMGCKFCASTIGGKVRNLTAAEMLDQVYASARDSGEKISGIVLMGIGEPLDNFDNVVRFLELVSHPQGLNLSLRHVSLSTCGIVDKIYKLADLKLGLTLSVSLHAADDQTRSAIMPINRRHDIKELMAACKYYFSKTGRRISFEYALIDQQNDSKEAALRLAGLLKGFPCHVNLIPINPVVEKEHQRSSAQRVRAFQTILQDKGLTATVRRELGSDIKAACGQLRHEQNSGVC